MDPYFTIEIFKTLADLVKAANGHFEMVRKDDHCLNNPRSITEDDLKIVDRVELETNAADPLYMIHLDNVLKKKYPNVIAGVNPKKEILGHFYQRKKNRPMLVSVDVVEFKYDPYDLTDPGEEIPIVGEMGMGVVETEMVPSEQF